MTSPSFSTDDQDPFRLDNEQLHALADAALIRAGLRHFRDRRVTRLVLEEEGLYAEVEDADSEEILGLSLNYDADGNLLCACGCDQNRGDGSMCVHGIAALFAHAGDSSGELSGALESAIEERAKRGRVEVRVEPISGDPWFGQWRAQSISPSSHFASQYRVHIRSLERRANHCTCPDFATNQLGTCKHIEAVLHRIHKRKDFKKIKALPPPHAFVFLDWDLDQPPAIRLHRGAETDVVLSPLLQEHFDAGGLYRRRLPEDFLDFAIQVSGRDDLDLGEDALAYARRLADNAARQTRMAAIRERLATTQGRLPGIGVRLYPYQIEGVAFLAGRGRALLADDMGLGKTLQAIAAATWLEREDQVERILVVCPASLKQQWAREIRKFSGAEARVIQGQVAARQAQYRGGRGWFVLNYELVMRDLSVIAQELRPDLLILDEAQRIKNWRTKIAATIKRIPSRYAFVLSGTPLENRLEDLYSLMQVVDPHVLGPLWRYLVDFHVTDERGKLLGYRNLSELRRRLAPVMLRRDRGLVRDQLPERIDQRLDLPLTERQREIHGEALNAASQIANILKRRPLTPAEQNRFMAALQRARMACDAAGLVDKVTEGSPKLDELDNLLDELCRLSGLKAVIFSQWELMTRMVEDRVRRLGLGCVRLHGGVPSARRGDLMDRFRDDDAVQVFIATDAGSTGLNLQNASVLINLDIPWNPAVLEQRIARVHRLGQSRTVQVILLVAADSYEQRVLGLVQGKRHLFDNVVDPEATEEVVGVSTKLAEALAQDLGFAAQDKVKEVPGQDAEDEAWSQAQNATSAGERHEGQGETGGPGDGLVELLAQAPITAIEEAALAEAEAGPAGPAARVPQGETEALEDEVRTLLLLIQEGFGPRIERILGARGGLLVVLDRVDEADDLRARDLSARIPLALIDRRTLGGLQRLGASSPTAGAETLFDATTAGTGSGNREAGPIPPLLRQARDRVQAAELLIAQACPGPAAELLLGAILATAAQTAGLDQAPPPQQAGVWLYPRGLLNNDQVALLMRAFALAQSGDLIPLQLLRPLAEDAARFLDEAMVAKPA